MDLSDEIFTPDYMDEVRNDQESPPTEGATTAGAQRDGNAISLHHYWPVVLGDPPVCTSARQGVEQSFVQYLLLWRATKGHLPTVQDTFELTAAVANSAFLTLQTPILTGADYSNVVSAQDDPGTAYAKLQNWAQAQLSPDIDIEMPDCYTQATPVREGRWKCKPDTCLSAWLEQEVLKISGIVCGASWYNSDRALILQYCIRHSLSARVYSSPSVEERLLYRYDPFVAAATRPKALVSPPRQLEEPTSTLLPPGSPGKAPNLADPAVFAALEKVLTELAGQQEFDTLILTCHTHQLTNIGYAPPVLSRWIERTRHRPPRNGNSGISSLCIRRTSPS